MNEEKLEKIYYQYRDLVMKTAYDVLNDFHLAQDVCQEVFIKMTPELIDRLSSSEQRAAYLRVVAYHRAVDYHRVLKLFKAEENIDAVQFSYENMEDDVVRKELCIDLLSGLKQKNEMWYEIVLRLGFYEEVPELVARDLGISLNLLRSKYHRAKRWVCKNYKSEYLLLNEVLSF